MMFYIMPLAANNSVMPLDLMFFRTPEQIFEMIERYGDAGRSVYLRIVLTAKADSNMQKRNVMPVGAWFFVMHETAGQVSIDPGLQDFMAWLTMIFGSLKWGFFIVIVVLVLIGLLRAAMKRFRKQAELIGV